MQESLKSIVDFKPTENIKLLVDGQNYYQTLFQTLLKAKKSIFISGWDLDSEVELIRSDQAPDGIPHQLGEFFSYLLTMRPELEIGIICWDFSFIYFFEREFLTKYKLKWQANERLKIKLDDNHPIGASRHEKYVIVDDSLLFVGGLDITSSRWDTREHLIDDERRVTPDQKSYGPFHDVQLFVQSPLAHELADEFRQRWSSLSDSPLSEGQYNSDSWPSFLTPDASGLNNTALVKTTPENTEGHAIYEVEETYCYMIGEAERYIYIENQYFTSEKICECLIRKLNDENGPSVILGLSQEWTGIIEYGSIGAKQKKLLDQLQANDPHGRLRVLTPLVKENKKQSYIKVHSKVFICDDRLFRVGSSNLNNRSMRVDSEVDFILESQSVEETSFIQKSFADLLGEHLGKELSSSIQQADGPKDYLHLVDEQNEESRRQLVKFQWDVPTWVDDIIPISSLQTQKGHL